MKKILLSCMLAFAVQYSMLAQNATLLKGKVVNQLDNAPLPGTIIYADENRAVVTDENGEFQIQLPEGKVELTISYLGFETQKVTLTIPYNENLIIKMSDEGLAMQEFELVSTGYQQLPKERATGSFVQIDGELVNRRVSVDILDRLEDVTPGLIFNRRVQGRDRPDLSIRGRSTIFANDQPLIVIDNFPYEGNISTLNPNDVESITVLKDAAAASIWGARAANGVIIITTKQGAFDKKMKVTYNGNFTSSERPDLFYRPQISPADFIGLERELFAQGVYNNVENSIVRAPVSPVVELLIAQRDGRIDQNILDSQLALLAQRDVRNDLQQYFYRPSAHQQHSFNISGGSKNHNYAISLGHDKVANNLIGNGRDRTSINFTNTFKSDNNKLKINTGIYYTNANTQNNNQGESQMNSTSGLGLSPYAALVDDMGNPIHIVKDYRREFIEEKEALGYLDWRYAPLNDLDEIDNRSTLNDYRINFRGSYEIIPGLQAELSYQYWGSQNTQNHHRSAESYFVRNLINRYTQENPDGTLTRPIPLGGILDFSQGNSRGHNGRFQINYNRIYQDKHQVTGIAGTEIKDVIFDLTRTRYFGYRDELAFSEPVNLISEFPLSVNRATQSRIPNLQGLSGTTDRFLSYYTNWAYVFDNKYGLSASARRDASNLFGVNANMRGVPLWSVGGYWQVQEEGFYNSSWLPYLKVRATYGYNGNLDRTISAYITSAFSGLSTNTGLPFARIQNPPNPNLRWERVSTTNLALDFEMKNSILSGSIEYFSKKGIDLIGSIPYAPSTGVTTFRGNTASTLTRGLDLTLRSTLVDKGVRWTSEFFLTTLKEEVLDYELQAAVASYLQNGAGAQNFPPVPLTGNPLFAVYSYQFAGLDPTTGDPMGFLDAEPSSNYSAVMNAVTPESLVFHGSATPTAFGALRNNVAWKNLSLSFNIAYRLGYYFRRESVRYSIMFSGNPLHGDYTSRWQQPGDELTTIVPSRPLTNNAQRDNFYSNSSALVEKGDHIRLQDIRIAYTLDRKSFSSLPFQRAEIYAYINNIGLLWKATDQPIDPDFRLLPPQRSLSLGLRIDF